MYMHVYYIHIICMENKSKASIEYKLRQRIHIYHWHWIDGGLFIHPSSHYPTTYCLPLFLLHSRLHSIQFNLILSDLTQILD